LSAVQDPGCHPCLARVVVAGAGQQCGARRDRAEWASEIVTEDADELVAIAVSLPAVAGRGFREGLVDGFVESSNPGHVAITCSLVQPKHRRPECPELGKDMRQREPVMEPSIRVQPS